MNPSLNDLLNRTVAPQTAELALRVRQRRGHIIGVQFPSHTFRVLMDGYGIQTVYADPSINFGTFARPLVFTGNDCICVWDETLQRWKTSVYESTLNCVPTQTVNPPFTPITTYTPPLDTATFNQPFNIDTNFSPLNIAMGNVLPIGALPVTGTDQEVYTISGTLSTSTGALRLYNHSASAWGLSLIYISVGTAPTGASIIVDVLINGTSIFNVTPANRPEIAASAYTGVSGVPDTKSIAAGEYFTVDVTQVGSTVAGADLTVQIPVAR